MSGPAPIAEGLFEVADGGAVLLAGRCTACGFPAFPAPQTCPACAGGPVEPLRLTGPARLWGWTAVTIAPGGYHGPVPYGFGAVDFDEGIRVLGRLTQPDPTALHRGQPMAVVTDTVPTGDGDEATVWAFAPLEDRS